MALGLKTVIYGVLVSKMGVFFMVKIEDFEFSIIKNEKNNGVKNVYIKALKVIEKEKV